MQARTFAMGGNPHALVRTSDGGGTWQQAYVDTATLAFFPVHILFLELIIDPACSVVFEMEEEEKDTMQRPPRKLDDPLFGKHMVKIGLVQDFIQLFRNQPIDPGAFRV